MSQPDRFPRSKVVAVGAILVNTLLTAGKFTLAWFSGSLALLAEAFHSLADIGSSLAVYVAIAVESRQKPLPENPSRLARLKHFLLRNAQQRVARGIGVFLMLGAVSLFYRIFTQASYQVENPRPFALAMLGMAVASYLLSRLERSVGEKEQAPALIADGYHAGVDMWASIFVALALFCESIGFRFDNVAALVISVVIFLQGVSLFRALDACGEQTFSHWLGTRANKACPSLTAAALRAAAALLRVRMEGDWKPRLLSRLAWSAVGLALAGYAGSGFFIVGPGQQAVVEILGNPMNADQALSPGLHYAPPWPAGVVRRVDTELVRSLSVGSQVSPDSEALLWTNIHYVQEFNTLSGENNYSDAGLTLHYCIVSPSDYLYGVANPEAMLEQFSYAALAREMARISLFDAMTSERDTLEQRIARTVRESLSRYLTGIEVKAFCLKDIHPPTLLAREYEDVVGATIDFQASINDALGEKNALIPTSRGEAVQMLEDARSQHTSIIMRSQGQAQRFEKNLRAYLLQPEVYKTRSFLTMAENRLPFRDKYIVPDAMADGSIDLFLDLNF